MRILLMILLLLVPLEAGAAYQNPTVIANERLSVGSTKLIFRFAGDDGEPIVTREYMIGPNTTPTILRNWVDATLDELNLMQAAATLPALQPGRVVPRLAPTVPAPSARAIWTRQVGLYREVCQSAFVGQVATDCAALKATIESTYQAGFLNVQ